MEMTESIVTTSTLKSSCKHLEWTVVQFMLQKVRLQLLGVYLDDTGRWVKPCHTQLQDLIDLQQENADERTRRLICEQALLGEYLAREEEKGEDSDE